MSALPPPSHPDAITMGCTCPRDHNRSGAGIGFTDAAGNPLYVFDMTCPIHWTATEMDPDETCYEESAEA